MGHVDRTELRAFPRFACSTPARLVAGDIDEDGQVIDLSREGCKMLPFRLAPLIEAGVTIFPGRAEGPVAHRAGGNLDPIPRGAILVVDQTGPELARLLPDAAAVVAAKGSPVGHLATLVREYAIPAVFQAGPAVRRMVEGARVSVDATGRRVYEGSRWPGIRERVLSRLSDSRVRKTTSPLADLILALNLTDPFAPGFQAGKCRSAHDVIRFIHEMAVRHMFKFGDSESRFFSRKTKRLAARVPMKILVLDLTGAPGSRKGEVAPESLKSIPFWAFWKGFADPVLAWPDRWGREMAGLPADFREEVLGGFSGNRRKNDPNYLIAAPDYLNFNARFSYHYAMVDAFVSEGDENNHVQFRFHNGGADSERRERRARFLEIVLRSARFSVDRRGDFVTAWLGRYPRRDCEEALEVLGRLLVCSRELDLFMRTEASVKMFAEKFVTGEFRSFS